MTQKTSAKADINDNNGRAKAGALCLVCYVAALAAAVAAGYMVRSHHPLVVAGIADLVATVVVFGFSFAFNNSSFYDPYWSVGPIALGVYWAYPSFSSEHEAAPLRVWLVLMLVIFWGARLTYNWYRGWKGLHHEDWRYVDYRHKAGRLYWLVSFSGIHMVPTILVFFGCVPLYFALTAERSVLGIIDFAPAAITAVAVVIELVSDNQLRRFVLSASPKSEIFSDGLWAYSRHPNYFGEVLFWWGLYLCCLSANLDAWWTIFGPLSITLLFWFISIPLIDKRHLSKRTNYADHMERVSALAPWPKK